MKTNNLKWIAIALSALMLLQSCKVYFKDTATLDEVVESQKRVKLKTNFNETYQFDRLQREEGLIYAYTKSKSDTAENLSDNGVEGKLDGKYLKVQLKDETIKEYHLQNKFSSTVINIAIPVLILSGAVFIYSLSSLYN